MWLIFFQCDLSHRQVDQMEIENFQRENNFIGWTETSAKEGLMVNDSMRQVSPFLHSYTPRQRIDVCIRRSIDGLSGRNPMSIRRLLEIY